MRSAHQCWYGAESFFRMLFFYLLLVLNFEWRIQLNDSSSGINIFHGVMEFTFPSRKWYGFRISRKKVGSRYVMCFSCMSWPMASLHAVVVSTNCSSWMNVLEGGRVLWFLNRTCSYVLKVVWFLNRTCFRVQALCDFQPERIYSWIPWGFI